MNAPWRVILTDAGALCALAPDARQHSPLRHATTVWAGDADGRDEALRHGRDEAKRLMLARTEH